MFGLDMTKLVPMLESFKDQAERMINAVEVMERDIKEIKTHLGIETAQGEKEGE